MTTGKAWSKWSRELAVASEDDFARKVRPFLRLLWPDLVETPRREGWDQAGLDYVSWTDDGPFPCIVQCKGFHVQALGKSQIVQVLHSVEQFLKSELSCHHFIVVHNRDGRFTDFNRRVGESLDSLVSAGVARTVELLDRQQLLIRCSARIEQLLEDSIRASSEERLRRTAALFDIGWPYLSDVPIAEGLLRLRRSEPCVIDVPNVTSRASVTDLLIGIPETPWTILEGSFGSGKTTTVLHAAISRERLVVYVPAASIATLNFVSLGQVLEAAVKAIDAFGSYEDTDREALERLSGAVALRLLSRPEAAARYVLIVDGLDENRLFARLEGLQRLVNQLTDIECPVVLTTRTEHLSTLFGNFSTALGELSWKFGARAQVRLLQLRAWDSQEILEFLDQVISRLDGMQRTRVIELRRSISDGSAVRLYGNLPSNPLLLRFLAEDVANEGLARRTRAMLLDRWVRRKIWRDAEQRKAMLDARMDIASLVSGVCSLMETVAGQMVSAEAGAFELSEVVDSELVAAEASRIFASEVDPILSILLHSVLSPIGVRLHVHMKLTFTFRILQEYFLASFLRREGRSPVGYPPVVQELHTELGDLWSVGSNPRLGS